MLHSGSEERLAVTDEMLAVKKRRTCDVLKQHTQLLSPLDDLSPSEVFTVEKQQIKGEENQSMRLVPDCRRERIEVGNAILVLDDYFSIYHRRTTGQAPASLDDGDISIAPVMAVPSERPDLNALFD
jgi:hypothetical protein